MESAAVSTSEDKENNDPEEKTRIKAEIKAKIQAKDAKGKNKEDTKKKDIVKA